jgi:hypothetical protein
MLDCNVPVVRGIRREVFGPTDAVESEPVHAYLYGHAGVR